MTFLLFLRSPLGRALAIGLLILGLIGTVYLKGSWDGKAHEHAAMQKQVDLIQTNLDTCHANVKALQASIDGQNAAVEAMQEISDRKAAEAAQALSVASKGRASAEARAAKLLARPPAGIDACARMESADAAVMEGVR